ncbi:MAG: hypothetical protein ABMB14_08735 [Myxococcota bacterium]
MWWLLACRPAATDDASGVTGETGVTSETGADGCVASATDGLGAEPWFDGWSGELVFRAAPGFSWLRGAFLDRPSVHWQVETDRIGACRLERYTPGFCEPACAGDQLCRVDTCVDWPRVVHGGAITLTGPVEPALVVAPDGLGGYDGYTYADVDRGADWVLTGAAGEDVPAFSAETCPVRAPTATADWDALLEARAPGTDVVLAWSDRDPSARIRLRMTTGTATHGGIAHAEVACEGPDTGSLVLPGAFLDALYSEGWACGECGGNELIRYRAGAIGATGAVFTAEAATWFWHIP